MDVSKLLSSAGYEANYKVVQSHAGKATQVWLGPYTEKDIAKKISVKLENITGEKGYRGKHTF